MPTTRNAIVLLSRPDDGYIPPVRDALLRSGEQVHLLGAPASHHVPFWVNLPDRISTAEFKPSQLAAAVERGLRIPRTLLTNDPTAFRVFYEQEHRQIICKPVWKSQLNLPSGQLRFIYTHEVCPEDMYALSGISATMHCFQECIPKALELRIVVIGRHVFAVEIYSQHAERSPMDWRRS